MERLQPLRILLIKAVCRSILSPTSLHIRFQGARISISYTGIQKLTRATYYDSSGQTDMIDLAAPPLNTAWTRKMRSSHIQNTPYKYLLPDMNPSTLPEQRDSAPRNSPAECQHRKPVDNRKKMKLCSSYPLIHYMPHTHQDSRG